MTAAQLRAARALLRWTRDDLAQASGVHKNTIRRLEKQTGPLRGITDTVRKLKEALEDQGVVFMDGGGVALSE